MTRPMRPAGPPLAPAIPARKNYGWGKLVGAAVLGVAGALALQLPGALTGMVLGAGLGHLFDLRSADRGEPLPVPPRADAIANEQNVLLAGEVRDAFAALERAAGNKADPAALHRFLRKHLGVDAPPPGGPAIPWQQDVASACTRLAPQLDGHQREALVVALYAHARALQLGPGPARLLLRDGVAALGVPSEREDTLRDQAGML